MDLRYRWADPEAEKAYNALLQAAADIQVGIVTPMVPEFPDRYRDARQHQDMLLEKAANIYAMFCMPEIRLAQ